MIPISVTILTKNCQATLTKTLLSVERFEEVVILDTGSTDATLEIARAFPNVKIHSSPFTGFGPLHNLATRLAGCDWILSLDSDEVLTAGLIEEIATLALDPFCVYAIERHNFFNGRQMKWCAGWHPDWVARIYNRNATQFENAAVHEKVVATGLQMVRLSHPIIHTPYREASDLLTKMQTYSTLYAEQHRGKKKSSLLRAIGHSWLAFIKNYLFKRGFLGGREGFIISLYNAHTTFYKYLKLSERT